MRVIVEDSVFTTSADVSLHALLRQCIDGRHQIEVVPSPSPHCEKWLCEHAGRAAEYYRQLLENSLRELATRAINAVLRVPQVPLPSALKLLDSPLSILVENELNDGAFLRAVLRGPRASEWQRALKNSWLAFDSGGGMQEIEKRVLSGSADPRRTYVVCDSDARRPGEPSPSACRLAGLCVNKRLKHHMLRRRERENYLPFHALQLWLEKRKRDKKTKDLRQLLGQFRRLTDEQRHHFNMRRGLKGDNAEAPLFKGLDRVVEQALHVGFGDEIGQIFDRPEDLLEDWLIDDGQGEEMHALLDEILALL